MGRLFKIVGVIVTIVLCVFIVLLIAESHMTPKYHSDDRLGFPLMSREEREKRMEEAMIKQVD